MRASWCRVPLSLTATLLCVTCASQAGVLQARRQEALVNLLRADVARNQKKLDDLAGQVAQLFAAQPAAADAVADPTENLQVVHLEDAAAQRADFADLDAPVDRRPPKVLHLPADAQGTAPATLFRRGLQAFARGLPKKACQAFESFLRASPEHPDAASARFWVGECKFEQGAYRDAISAFQALHAQHPDNSKTAEAWLKMGLAYERLHDVQRAREAFSTLVAGFPASALADLARSRLANSGVAYAP